MSKRRWGVVCVLGIVAARAAVACDDSSSSGGGGGFDAGQTTFDGFVPPPPPPSPLPEASTDAGTDGAPVLLTSGIQSTLDLIVQGSNLYWIEGPQFGENSVRTCSTNGCATAKTLVTESTATYIRYLATDGTTVFYTTQDPSGTGRVMKVDVATADAGGGTLLWADVAAQPWGVAVGPTGLYWADYSSGDLVRCDPADCVGTRAVIGNGGPRVGSVKLTASAAFWLGEGNPSTQSFASTCALPSCDAGVKQLMYPGHNARLLRLAEPNFYFLNLDTTNFELRTCPLTGCPDGGPAAKVSSDETDPATQTLAANASSVYWISANRIVSCPAGGCDGGAAAVHTTLTASETPKLLAADETSIYILTTQGNLWRAPK